MDRTVHKQPASSPIRVVPVSLTVLALAVACSSGSSRATQSVRSSDTSTTVTTVSVSSTVTTGKAEPSVEDTVLAG